MNNETQSEQSLVSCTGVPCSLLVPDAIRLPLCIPSISYGYCSICHYGTCIDVSDDV